MDSVGKEFLNPDRNTFYSLEYKTKEATNLDESKKKYLLEASPTRSKQIARRQHSICAGGGLYHDLRNAKARGVMNARAACNRSLT